jgi:hypothetical protein
MSSFLSYLPPASFPLDAERGATKVEVSEARDVTGLLPIGAEVQGWRLWAWDLRIPERRDPWVLYDPRGRTVKEWLFEPTLGELREALRLAQP